MNAPCIHGCDSIANCIICNDASQVLRYVPPDLRAEPATFPDSTPMPQPATPLQRLAIASALQHACPNVMDDEAVAEFVAMLDAARVALKSLGLL